MNSTSLVCINHEKKKDQQYTKDIWHIVNKKSARHYFQAHSQLGNSPTACQKGTFRRGRGYCVPWEVSDPVEQLVLKPSLVIMSY